MKKALLILGLLLLINAKTGVGEMDGNSVIALLNYSKNLIQDGEMSFLFYEQFPTLPDEKGERLSAIVEFREQELRDADKDEDPAAYRKAIIKNLEKEKKYEPFQDSDKYFMFAEASLAFKKAPDYVESGLINYRMNVTCRFENYPSLGSIRYFNAGYEYLYLSNTVDNLLVLRATQFNNTAAVSGIDKARTEDTITTVNDTTHVPPTDLIDVKRAQVHPTEFSGDRGYIITHFPYEDELFLKKVYVRISPLPEVFREEYYFQSDSPNANADGYWLRLRREYSDFYTVEGLNLAVPKVRVHKEFRSDGLLHRQTVYTIQEMNFNLGLPDNFFEWQETDLQDDEGQMKEIREH